MKLTPTPVCTMKGFLWNMGKSPHVSKYTEAGEIEGFDLTGLFTPLYPSTMFENKYEYPFKPKEKLPVGDLAICGVFAIGNPYFESRVIFATESEENAYHEFAIADLLYAIKVRAKTITDVENLDFEAGLNFSHPNITKVTYAGETTDNKRFGLMELVDGISLHQAIELLHSKTLNPDRPILKQKRRRDDNILTPFQAISQPVHGTHSGIEHYEKNLPIFFSPEARVLLREQLKKEILQALLTVAEIFLYLSSVETGNHKGIVHRDIKPLNILLTCDDGKITPHVIDFGACCHPYVEEGALKTGIMKGTLGYAAPELISGGDINSQTDFFSLSALIYKVFSGKAPFKGINQEQTMRMTAENDPEPLTQADFNDFVMRGLAKNPSKRLSGNDFVEELRQLLSA